MSFVVRPFTHAPLNDVAGSSSYSVVTDGGELPGVELDRMLGTLQYTPDTSAATRELVVNTSRHGPGLDNVPQRPFTKVAPRTAADSYLRQRKNVIKLRTKSFKDLINERARIQQEFNDKLFSRAKAQMTDLEASMDTLGCSGEVMRAKTPRSKPGSRRSSFSGLPVPYIIGNASLPMLPSSAAAPIAEIVDIVVSIDDNGGAETPRPPDNGPLDNSTASPLEYKTLSKVVQDDRRRDRGTGLSVSMNALALSEEKAFGSNPNLMKKDPAYLAAPRAHDGDSSRKSRERLEALKPPVPITLTPLQRFRKVAQAITNTIRSLNERSESKRHAKSGTRQVSTTDSPSKHVSYLLQQSIKEETVPFAFSLKHFIKPGSSLVTDEMMAVLCKSSDARTEKELDLLQGLTVKVQSFNKYSRSVRRELCRVIRYENYEKKRVIVKQGHPPHSFYFILSGVVDLVKSEVVARTGRTYSQTVAELHAGDSFGELAILKKVPRSASVICKQDCEFLSVTKEDFEEVLKSTANQELEAKRSFLRTYAIFETLSDAELTRISECCTVKEYKHEVAILQEGDISDNIFFIKKVKRKSLFD